MQSEVDSRARLVIVGVIVVALFTGLLTRLWFLQVTGGEQLAVAAQRQRDRVLSVPARRGAILDAKGRVLAETVVTSSLTVDRQDLTPDQRKDLVARLAFFLATPPAEIERRLDSTQYAPYEAVPVAELTKDQFVYFSEHGRDFPHTHLATTPRRVYPYGAEAAHVVGYLGRINQDELAARPNAGYGLDDTIGKDGVELTYEDVLRGQPGKETVQVDSRGQATAVTPTKKPVAGQDVQLSIDLDAQGLAEESLQQGIDGARSTVDKTTGRYHDPTGGAVVVLDARTGQLVAMASAPTFDPNAFVDGNADQYLTDPAHPLFDRAVSPYAPGSTFKLLTSIATLKYGIRAADETFYDSGCFKFGNEADTRCNAGKAAYGYVDLPKALTVSSDVFFYNVGNEFWLRYNNDEGSDASSSHPVGYGIQDVARDFGFDAPTGVELQADSKGRIPDLAFSRALNKCDANGVPHVAGADRQSCTWRRGDSASLAVGQGDVLVTPLQLANAYATFANGGTLYTPQLVENVRQSDAGLAPGQMGPVVRASSPMVKTNTGLDPTIRGVILGGLDGVVNSGEGTAYAAFRTYDGPKVVGKTGTAQNQGKGDTSWFAAITNPDNDPARPQYVVVAMVEEGGFGADVAAPIVRRVIDYLNGNPNPAPVDVAPVNPNKPKDAGD
ncbi:MAG: penicillin-binding protein 2 [Acidimicrobiia bacterium]